jgi:HrpA-like RNA helicase
MEHKEEHSHRKPGQAATPAGTKLHESKDDEKLTRKFQEIQKRACYQNMLRFREQLPIYKTRSMILETIKLNPVSIICAETGSGTFRS